MSDVLMGIDSVTISMKARCHENTKISVTCVTCIIRYVIMSGGFLISFFWSRLQCN